MIRLNPSRENIAFQMFKFHFEYLKGLSNYNVNKMGWIKRLLKRYSLVAYSDFNSSYVESKLSTVTAIKDYCIKEMSYLINI
ncbi:hypothetical protein, partial [Kaistella sp.]|uniref:hypothetical protein n=1 Tax=Kaistella sp. TaxID=2782235 RepID=UPI003C4A383F